MVRKKSIPESKEKVLKPCGFRTFVAAGEGFEPSHTESEFDMILVFAGITYHIVVSAARPKDGSTYCAATVFDRNNWQ